MPGQCDGNVEKNRCSRLLLVGDVRWPERRHAQSSDCNCGMNPWRLEWTDTTIGLVLPPKGGSHIDEPRALTAE